MTKLTARQQAVLRLLNRARQPTAREIAAKLGVTVGRVGQIIARLEALGAVRRTGLARSVEVLS